MRGPRISLPVAVAAGVFVLLLAFGLFVLGPGGNAAADAGGMEAMSLDMDVAGNTATSLGPWDGCVEARPGDLLTLDVTALNIPASAPMIGFTFVIGYQEAVVRVESQDARFLLAANAGSALLNLSEATPDQDFNDRWNADALDISTTAPEDGSGVLTRLGVTVGRDAPDGLRELTLVSGGHVDERGELYSAEALNGGTIAVGVPCPPVSATQTPAPTPPPQSTPTPAPPTLFIEFEPEVQLLPGNESVTVRGTVTCLVAGMVNVGAAVIQSVNGKTVIAAPADPLEVECNQQTAWSRKFSTLGDKFRPGLGEIVVIADDHIQRVGSSGAVRLKPGAIK